MVFSLMSHSQEGSSSSRDEGQVWSSSSSTFSGAVYKSENAKTSYGHSGPSGQGARGIKVSPAVCPELSRGAIPAAGSFHRPHEQQQTREDERMSEKIMGERDPCYSLPKGNESYEYSSSAFSIATSPPDAELNREYKTAGALAPVSSSSSSSSLTHRGNNDRVACELRCQESVVTALGFGEGEKQRQPMVSGMDYHNVDNETLIKRREVNTTEERETSPPRHPQQQQQQQHEGQCSPTSSATMGGGGGGYCELEEMHCSQFWSSSDAVVSASLRRSSTYSSSSSLFFSPSQETSPGGMLAGPQDDSNGSLGPNHNFSYISFDESGDFLAAATVGGAVCVFRTNAAKNRRRGPRASGMKNTHGTPPPQHQILSSSSSIATTPTSSRIGGRKTGGNDDDEEEDEDGVGDKNHGGGEDDYSLAVAFQSHKRGFDYLKSAEISERINSMQWCRGSGHRFCGGAHLLVTTNDRTPKLHKIYERRLRSYSYKESLPPHERGWARRLGGGGGGGRRDRKRSNSIDSSSRSGGSGRRRSRESNISSFRDGHIGSSSRVRIGRGDWGVMDDEEEEGDDRRLALSSSSSPSPSSSSSSPSSLSHNRHPTRGRKRHRSRSRSAYLAGTVEETHHLRQAGDSLSPSSYDEDDVDDGQDEDEEDEEDLEESGELWRYPYAYGSEEEGEEDVAEREHERDSPRKSPCRRRGCTSYYDAQQPQSQHDDHRDRREGGRVQSSTSPSTNDHRYFTRQRVRQRQRQRRRRRERQRLEKLGGRSGAVEKSSSSRSPSPSSATATNADLHSPSSVEDSSPPHYHRSSGRRHYRRRSASSLSSSHGGGGGGEGTCRTRRVRSRSGSLGSEGIGGGGTASHARAWLRIPTVHVTPWHSNHGIVTAASARRVYRNAHVYNVHSVSMLSTGDTFLSGDDLRINLWNLEVDDRSYTVVDAKPVNMVELTEIITVVTAHPSQGNLFAYGTSTGSTRLCDTRCAAHCDKSSKEFGGTVCSPPAPSATHCTSDYLAHGVGGAKTTSSPFPGAPSPLHQPGGAFGGVGSATGAAVYSELVSSVLDCRFSPGGYTFCTRDFMSLKVWDVRLEARPVRVIGVHEHLRPMLSTLYQNEALFDRFSCGISGDGRYVL